ncbi:uncharacterized protein LOC127850522 isoform X2 [Dreissena polymorpha]|uniref:Uncharacterized protein n=1 Tax=Dreissena polymorpha TaxID=45954 RepID=A0A9D4D6D7_DREPO|nr:uncharacterized protein LOC127850522 isoform X2 [Dreissena polymorpha]KAH3739004.1 hypothetical protein DPMN_045648 [Dreissena polymorpha]
MLSSNNTQPVAAEVDANTEHIHVDTPMRESGENNENAERRTMAANGVEVNAEGYQEFNTDLRVNKFNKQLKKGQKIIKIEEGLRTTLREIPQDVLVDIELLADGHESAKVPDFLQRLVSEKKFLHLQLLLENVGLSDVADQVSTLAEICDQIHLRPITTPTDSSTNRQTLVLVVTQACEAGKHVDRVREWLSGYTIVEANIWDCECCMEKTRQLKACTKCIEHIEAKNAYMRTNYVGVAVDECLARAADFNIKDCQSNCIKCRKVDVELISKRLAVRNILN